MKIPVSIVLAIVASLFAVGAGAETYEGVHPLSAGARRNDVSAQARAATKAGNPHGDAANAGVVSNPSPASRATARAQAIQEARDPVTGVDRRTYFSDRSPSPNGQATISSTTSPALR